MTSKKEMVESDEENEMNVIHAPHEGQKARAKGKVNEGRAKREVKTPTRFLGDDEPADEPKKRARKSSTTNDSSEDEGASFEEEKPKRKAAKKAKKAPSTLEDDDDDVYEADAEEVSPSSKKAAKKGTKKKAPAAYVPGQKLNLDLTAFEMPENLMDKGEDAIKGLRFGSAGLLVTRESPLHALHITETALSGK